MTSLIGTRMDLPGFHHPMMKSWKNTKQIKSINVQKNINIRRLTAAGLGFNILTFFKAQHSNTKTYICTCISRIAIWTRKCKCFVVFSVKMIKARGGTKSLFFKSQVNFKSFSSSQVKSQGKTGKTRVKSQVGSLAFQVRSSGVFFVVCFF